MRRIAILVSLVVGSLGVLAAPAGASHSPCSSLDPVCLRVECPGSQPGYGWIYVNFDLIPHVDFTDCAGG